MLCLKKAARCQSCQRSLQLRSVIRGISGFMGFIPPLSVTLSVVIVLAPAVQTLDSAIHRITQLVLLVFIRWIVIYPVDSAIYRLNNWGLVYSLYPKYVDEKRKKENNGQVQHLETNAFILKTAREL